MKQRYDTVNEKLWNLETRMNTMSKDHAESSCAIQSKLDALLRNSIVQDKLIADRPQGTTVDFIEPERNKRESTPLPRTATSTGTGGRSSCRGNQQSKGRLGGKTNRTTTEAGNREEEIE